MVGRCVSISPLYQNCHQAIESYRIGGPPKLITPACADDLRLIQGISEGDKRLPKGDRAGAFTQRHRLQPHLVPERKPAACVANGRSGKKAATEFRGSCTLSVAEERI